MIKTLDATLDGEVLRPVEPVDLEPHTRVRITLEEVDKAAEQHRSFLQTARSLNLQGPPDWSARLDAGA